MDREEAIRRIKAWNLDSDDREVLAVVIPELAESEDERIMEDLIGGLMWQRDNLKSEGPHDNSLILPGFCLTVGEQLSYLEKQKECFADSSKTSASEDERIRKKLINFLRSPFIKENLTDEKVAPWLEWLEKQKPYEPHNWPADKDNLIQEQKPDDDPLDDPKFLKGFDTGREVHRMFDEQKPAEWSEEDNIGWDEAFACVTRVEKAAKNEEELQNAVTAEKWLKEIKFKYCVHPVKSEWSEEDKEMLLSIINAFRNGTVSTIGQEQWLKTLHKRFNLQPKQEWSDEDEKKILF